ncbi:LacI family DNA-binding transcriptional regulator [Cognatishimia sp. F0-27]|uniref:LacI family DNA-binding transcriptional regulator n=1 Tax=Cognatishimia sp. F0-27 TaxID=2816855 RepID=UPI001D0C67AC|nr:LacI family DNA-binding transcriptional regulator [Cognatishimia sp. F0-27]MCC1495113.1 LacI family DNA-binding transcriptional regulator [Cognatishimia sp. F0-27]
MAGRSRKPTQASNARQPDSSDSKGPVLPTLEDVAREAGVSTATVSRCINAPDRVVKATRERVQNAIQALGYSPNFGARALAAKQTNTIGAVIPTMENAIFARGLQAFQETLAEAGQTLLVASSGYDPGIEEEQIRTLISRGADGLLLIGYNRSERIYEFLEKRHIPYVVAWAYDPGSSATAVGFDNAGAMAALASEVLRQGHRRLAIISGHRAGNDRAEERVRGVRSAARAFGLDPDDIDVIETVYSVDSGGTAMAQLLDRKDRPTAVICGNDVLAVGAIRKAQSLGFRVPQDVSVTGFDDIELATLIDPGLTTVHVPHREMGRQAARSILALLNESTELNTVCLETFIVHRGSLGKSDA